MSGELDDGADYRDYIEDDVRKYKGRAATGFVRPESVEQFLYYDHKH